MSDYGIEKYVHIKNNTIFVDGQLDFKVESEGFGQFAKSVYKNYGIKYSKFYKMDFLCKLGFLSSEILLKDSSIRDYNLEEISVVLCNSSSSISDDYKYQNTIEDIPSPAVFVYTLPNIVIGEICIRNGFKGESTFFVNDYFDAEFIENYINSLFNTTNTSTCITGWIEIDEHENYEAFLCLVCKKNKKLKFDSKNLNKIYTELKL